MNPKLIYDVGMHNGADSDFYLKKGFDVVGIEANPALAAHCEKKFANEIASGQLKVVNRAVAETSGVIDFYLVDDNDLWGTADPEWKERSEKLGISSRVIQVKSDRMEEIIAEYGVPYYMKIDIEGYDHLCLMGLDGMADKPKHVSIESSATSLRATMAQLELRKKLGYTKFKMILQNDVHSQKCPFPAREGAYVDYQFSASTSGLFGDELPGAWLNYYQTVDAYKLFYRKVAVIGPHTGMFRNIKNNLAKRVLYRLFHPGAGWYDTHATY